MSELKYEIKRHVATISEGNEGEYTLELNIISWNDNEPKLDLRRWKRKQDGTKIAQKGLTISKFELNGLNEALKAVL